VLLRGQFRIFTGAGWEIEFAGRLLVLKKMTRSGSGLELDERHGYVDFFGFFGLFRRRTDG